MQRNVPISGIAVEIGPHISKALYFDRGFHVRCPFCPAVIVLSRTPSTHLQSNCLLVTRSGFCVDNNLKKCTYLTVTGSLRCVVNMVSSTCPPSLLSRSPAPLGFCIGKGTEGQLEPFCSLCPWVCQFLHQYRNLEKELTYPGTERAEWIQTSHQDRIPEKQNYVLAGKEWGHKIHEDSTSQRPIVPMR